MKYNKGIVKLIRNKRKISFEMERIIRWQGLLDIDRSDFNKFPKRLICLNLNNLYNVDKLLPKVNFEVTKVILVLFSIESLTIEDIDKIFTPIKQTYHIEDNITIGHYFEEIHSFVEVAIFLND